MGRGIDNFIANVILPTRIAGRFVLSPRTSRDVSNVAFFRDSRSWTGVVYKPSDEIEYAYLGNGWCTDKNQHRVEYCKSGWQKLAKGASFEVCEKRCSGESSCVGYLVEDQSNCATLCSNGEPDRGIFGWDGETRNDCYAKYSANSLATYSLVGNGWCLNGNAARIELTGSWMAAPTRDDASSAYCEWRCAHADSCIGYIVEDRSKCNLISASGDGIDGIRKTDSETRCHCWAKSPPSAPAMTTTSVVLNLRKNSSKLSPHQNYSAIPSERYWDALQGQGPFDWVSLHGDIERVRAAILSWNFIENPVSVMSVSSTDREIESRLSGHGYIFLGKFLEHIWIIPRDIYNTNLPTWNDFCSR